MAPVVKPAAADRPDPAGAEAFARYWLDELNAAYDTMDTRKLKAISQTSCQTCQNYILSINRAVSEGKRYEGGEVIVQQVVAAPLEGTATNVLVNCDFRQGTAYDQNNHLVVDVPEERGAVLNVSVARVASRWAMAEVASVK